MIRSHSSNYHAIGKYTTFKITHYECIVQLKDRKRSEDLMSMLGLNETVDRKHFSLVWSCVEERGQKCLEKGIRF